MYNDIRFSMEEMREEAAGNHRRIDQLFTGVEYKHANVVRLIHNPSEIRMAFGDSVPNPAEKGIVVIRPLVGVSMPHQMARQLIVYLQRQIDAIDAAKTGTDDPKKEDAGQTP